MKRLLAFLVFLTFLGAALLFSGLPFLLKDYLSWRFKESEIEAMVGPVRLLWPLRLQVEKVSLPKGELPLVSFDLLTGEILPKSLLSRELLISHLALERPQFIFSKERLSNLGKVWKGEENPSLLGYSLRVFSGQVEGGEILWERGFLRELNFIFKEISLETGGFSVPPKKEEIPFLVKGLFGSPHYRLAPFRLKGTLEGSTGNLHAHLSMKDVDLLIFESALRRSIPGGLEKGWMDVEGEFWIRNGYLRGQGLLQIRGLSLKEGEATQLLGVFELTQGQLLKFLKDSEGKLVLPVTLSGNLRDPQFRLGKVLTRSVAKSLALTVQRGVERMFRFGTGPEELEKVQEKAKRAFKELEKTLRLDWLLSTPPQ